MAKKNVIEKRRKKSQEQFEKYGKSKYELKQREIAKLNKIESSATTLSRCINNNIQN